MCTDVNACNCTPWYMDTVRESALKADSMCKIPCRTGELNLHQWHAGLTLYQLSCIPNQLHPTHHFISLEGITLCSDLPPLHKI